MAERGALLTSPIMAIIGALRENLDKYNIIFDNSKYDNSSEYHEGLVEVANSFMKILSRQIVDNTMVEAVAIWTKMIEKVYHYLIAVKSCRNHIAWFVD